MHNQLPFLAAMTVGIAFVQGHTADAITIGPSMTGTLVPTIIDRSFGFSLDISRPTGLVEIIDLAADGTTVATTSIFFDSSGDGTYQLDMTYLGPTGLVDIEPLLPGLDLTGQLGGGRDALEPWVSEHTELNSGKIIWSFSDGTVITLDPKASEIDVDTRSGSFTGSVPPSFLEVPARILIQNNTSDAIDALNLFVPGDFNGDGMVDADDVDIWTQYYGTISRATPGMGDADGDGDVDGRDFLAWQQNEGYSLQLPPKAATTALPEPGTLGQITLVVLIWLKPKRLRM